MRHMFHSIHQANFSKLCIESNRFRVIYLLLANSNRRHEICQLIPQVSRFNLTACDSFVNTWWHSIQSTLLESTSQTHKDSPLDQTPVQPQIKLFSAFNSILLIAITCKPFTTFHSIRFLKIYFSTAWRLSTRWGTWSIPFTKQTSLSSLLNQIDSE